MNCGAGMTVILISVLTVGSRSSVSYMPYEKDIPQIRESSIDKDGNILLAPIFSESNGIISPVHTYNNNNMSSDGVISMYINDQMRNNMKKLNTIAQLDDNWNGYDAPKFDTRFIEKIRAVVVQLKRQPEIFPTACNSIQLEYEEKNGKYLEIEISEKEDCEIFCIDEMGNETSKSIKLDIAEIKKVVESFYG